MTEQNHTGQARRAALDRIDKGEKLYKASWAMAVTIEAAFLVSFVLLADFSDRLHLLLLISAMAVYLILAFGLLALGSHVSRCAHRVLKAIERQDSGGKW